MVVTEFPANPRDGTIFQSSHGVFFVYERASNAWVRVTGGPTFPLATPLSDGLMAATDLKKINRLYVPLPRTTITSEQCTGRFVSGNIDLFSIDDFVKISGNANLLVPGRSQPLQHRYRLTIHTAGLDFGINKDTLIKYLLENGQLVLKGPTGLKGRKGPRGDAGNKFPTGPKGPRGDAGVGPSCQFTVADDNLNYERVPGSNKAVVDIETRKVSSTTYVIVLKQGVIGNPNINPDQLKINCGDNSTWALAVTASSGTVTPIYYLDLFPIVDTIRAKYEAELQRLKAGHERIVEFWLSKLMSLFDSEKSALCCALFNCLKTVAKIPKPRDIHPEPLLVSVASGSPPVPPPRIRLEDVGPLPGTLAAAGQRPSPAAISTPQPRPKADFIEAAVMVDITQANLGGDDKAVLIELPAGRYRVTIDDCCLRIGRQYAGNVRVFYNLSGARRVTQFPSVGYFTQPRLAANAYSGLSVDIHHAGGSVGVYYPISTKDGPKGSDVDGHIRLRFLRQHEVLPDRTCSLTENQLMQLAKIWSDLGDKATASKDHVSIGCGLVMRVAGQDYIIVQAPLPTIDCLAKFGNPAVAWPTLDGQNFMPSGPGPYIFKLDKNLNELVIANLADSAFTDVRGCHPVAAVDGNIWVSKSIKQVAMESFINVIFPIN